LKTVFIFLLFIASNARADFVLAGEHVAFDDSLQPVFSQHQIVVTSPITRAGFARWAATIQGRALIARFRSSEYEIAITEDQYEEGPGRAPQPGIRTFLSLPDHTAVKRFDLILNPFIASEYGRYPTLALGHPSTPIDVMTTAWAAEMLHIDFYSRGVPLPHPDRDDFQERWKAVALELGFPAMNHD
jgi:hypothetical protein